MTYKAFISYSHAADDALAPALQHGLQTLARPWNRRRALEIFRDQTGLAVSPGLWSGIRSALDQSEFFVLLASPEAASSVWVDREIQQWIAGHPLDHLLPVLTGGEWLWDPSTGDFDPERSTAVPPSLMGLFDEEPRHLDLRWARTEGELDLRNSRFRDAVAQLAAPMHSMTPEDLESADVSHYRQVVRLRRAVVLVLSVLLVLVSVASVVAVRNTREARHQQNLADSNAQHAEKQAQLALALKLLAQADALGPEQKTLSLLLDLEATRLEPTESWGSLIDGMAALPGLDRIVELPDGVDAADPKAIDPTGTTLASATREGDIRLWSLADRGGEPLVLRQPPELYPKVPDRVVFAQGGLLAARYVCREHDRCGQRRIPRIAVWDLDTMRSHTLPDSAGFGTPVFASGGNTLAAASRDGQVRIWDGSTAGVRETLALPRSGIPFALALSADGSRLAVGDHELGRIHLFRLDGTQRRSDGVIQLPAGQRPAQLEFGSRNTLVCRSDTGLVTVWDPQTRAQRTTSRPIAGILDVAVGPDGGLATAGRDGLLKLWDLSTLRQEGSGRPWGSTTDSHVQLMFAGSARIMSTSSAIRVWDRYGWDRSGQAIDTGSAAVTALAVSPSGVMASADERGVVTLRPPAALGRGSLHFDTGAEPVTALAVSDALVATGHQDGVVRLWDLGTGRPRGSLPTRGHGGVVTMAFRPGGDLLAVGYQSSRGRVSSLAQTVCIIWDIPNGRVFADFPAGEAGDVKAVAFGPGHLFASAGSDYLTLRDLSSGEFTVLVQDRRGRFSDLAFSPDGSTLAAAGHQPGQERNRPVSLWDPAQSADQVAVGLESGPSPGRDGTFDALAYSPDGRLLVGAGAGGLQLWDAETHQPIGGLITASAARSVVVTPDGQQIVVADEDGRLEAFPATLAGWRSLACRKVTRNLTESEWSTYIGPARPYELVCPRDPGD